MKVNIYNSPDIEFKELSVGACYMFDGNLYMRVQKCRNETEDWKTYNAVRLATGELADFCESCWVHSVDARAVVE